MTRAGTSAAARGRSLWQIPAAAVLYFGAASLSLPLAAPGAVISPLWPPAAVALVLCLHWGARIVPGLWLGATLAFLLRGWTPMPALITGAAAALAAWCGCALMHRLQNPGKDFIYNGNLFRFVLIAVASGLLSAPLAAAGAALGERLGPQPWLGWLTWTVGTATGTIIFTPLLRACRYSRAQAWPVKKVAEALLFATLVPVVAYITFSDWFGPWPLSYLPLPLMLWAAHRFNLPAVTWSTAAICVMAAWGTLRGIGPFGHADLNTALLQLTVYVSVVGIVGLTLSSLIHQRGVAETRLKQEMDTLEQRVLERTEALRAELEQRQRVERKLAEAQRVAQIGSWNWDLATREIVWSDQLFHIYDLPIEAAPMRPREYMELVHASDRPMVIATFEHCRETGKPFSIEHRICLPDGRVRYVSARGQGECNAGGQIVRLFGTVQDITEAREAEAALREAQERYRLVVELSPDAILVQQDRAIVLANPAAVHLLGATSRDAIVGRSLFDFLHHDFQPASRERLAALQKGHLLPPAEKKLVRLDGEEVDVEMTSSPFSHQARFAVLYIMRDITERKRNAEQMAYLAHYDSLTGLPNRVLFHQRLEHALSIASRPGRSLEILFLDLDRFKQINDTLGHATGDLVLQETARRLRACLREADTVARLAGDEFVVLVENVEEPQRGGTIAEKILAAFSPPFPAATAILHIGASIGIAAYPGDGTDAATLLKRADSAMYRAKQQGRNSYCYYSSQLNTQSVERRTLEQALRVAVERGQMSVHYQPRVDIASGRVTGMEALLRWDHPDLGMLAPRHFLPLAEKNGLIMPIGYWALRTACAQTRQWLDDGAQQLKVAVNISLRQLRDPAFVDNLRAILDDTGLPPQALEIEVTEQALMSEPDNSARLLQTLSDAGISVTIDDFGTGYSSMAHLQDLPFGAVKIDRSFVQGLPADARRAAVTRGIINLAHSLECRVVAQGAETQQQFDFLRDNDCDSVQGFYFSAAMPPAHFNELVHAQFH